MRRYVGGNMSVAGKCVLASENAAAGIIKDGGTTLSETGETGRTRSAAAAPVSFRGLTPIAAVIPVRMRFLFASARGGIGNLPFGSHGHRRAYFGDGCADRGAWTLSSMGEGWDSRPPPGMLFGVQN
jgi:hypothetical protein